MRSYALCASLISALAFPLKSTAAQKTDWAVFVEQDPKQCWAVTAPKSGAYKQNKRGERLLMVFFRPEARADGQLGVTVGYKIRPGYNVFVRVGNKSHRLFTEGEWSWSSDARTDDQIVRAFMRGSEAEVTVHKGTKVTDWYKFSLLGFTEAYTEAKRLCR